MLAVWPLAVVLAQADGGCRLLEVDRASSTLRCADHEVLSFDLLALAIEAPPDAGETDPEPSPLEKLKSYEDADLRSAPFELDASHRGTVMTWRDADGGTRTAVTVFSHRVHLCQADADVPQALARCRPTLASLVAAEAPAAPACDVVEETPTALNRRCGTVNVTDHVSNTTVAKERAALEAKVLSVARQSVGARVRVKTTPLRAEEGAWAGWIGFPQFPKALFVRLQPTENGLRTLTCAPRKDGLFLHEEICPALLTAFLAEGDPLWHASQRVLEPALFGRRVEVPKGCKLEQSTPFTGGWGCEGGAVIWFRGRGHPPQKGTGDTPCLVAGRPARCTRNAGELAGRAEDGPEWVQVRCLFNGPPATTCGALIEPKP